MNRVVLDTDVVSFLFKNDARARKYQPHLGGKEVVISFMTLAESSAVGSRSSVGE